MDCEFILKVEGEEISFKTTESPESDQLTELITAFKNNPEAYSKLKKLVEEKYSFGFPTSVDINELQKGPVTHNYTLDEFKKVIDFDVTFPEGVTCNILYVSSAKKDNKRILTSKRIINSDGKEIFVIPENYKKKRVVYLLANFLKYRKILQDNPNLYSEESDYYEDLNIIKTTLNEATIADMLLNFLEGDDSFENKITEDLNKNYKTKYFKNSKGEILSVYLFLKDFTTSEVNKFDTPKIYNDPIITILSRVQKSIKEKESKLKKYKINLEYLYYALVNNGYKDKLSSLNIKSLKAFKENISSKEYDKSLFENPIEDAPLLTNIVKEILDRDPSYRKLLVSFDLNGIILESKNLSIEEEVGANWETERTFDPIDNDCYGYKIYKYLPKEGEPIFILNKGFLYSDSTYYSKFNSYEEAKEAAKEKALNEKIRYNSFLNFKYRSKDKATKEQDKSEYIYHIENSPLVYTPGTLIETLDIVIDPDTDVLEKNLIVTRYKDKSDYPTVKDFHNIIDRKWNISDEAKETIKNLINNGEKTAAFIYKASELFGNLRTDEEGLVQLALLIAKAPKKQYYIDSQIGNNSYSVIPVSNNEFKQAKKNTKYPSIKLFKAISKALGEKIGVKVNLVTSSEVSEKFKGIDPNLAKAFIKDGQIYINTTIASGSDLVHEYVHLVLGALKTNPKTRNRYMELLVNMYNVSGESVRKTIENDYLDLSDIDKMEELFAKLFSNYIMGHISSNVEEVSDLFKQDEAIMKSGLKSIFEIDETESLSAIYSRSLSYLCRAFSNDINQLLNSESGLELKEIQNSRKKSKWVSEQIKKGEINELCQ